MMLWFLGTVIVLGLQAQSQPLFRIGILDQANGPLLRGAKLAVDQINSLGGVTGADGTQFALELVSQSPDRMKTAVANINQASVIAVIGPQSSTLVQNNLQLLLSLQVPVLTPATDDTLTLLDTSDRIIRIRASEGRIGEALADYIVRDVQITNIATVQLDLESTVGVVGFTNALARLGVGAPKGFILESGTQLSDFAGEINTARPDVVVVYGPPDAAAEVYNQLRAVGWTGILAYNNAWDPVFLNAVPAVQRGGILGATTFSYGSLIARSERFTLDFLREYGAAPTPIEVAAYDGIYMIAQAIGSPGQLKTNLLQISGLAGAQGLFTSAMLTGGETIESVYVYETTTDGGQQALAQYVAGVRQDQSVIPAPTGEPPILVTATPAATATPQGVVVTILRNIQNVRSGPATYYDIIAQVRKDEQYQVVGANADLTWVVINVRGTQGWLSRDILSTFGNLNTVPLITPPPTPTPLPATATSTPAPQADLVILSVLPTRLFIGVPFNVTVTIRNQGLLDAGPFAVASTLEPGGVYSAVNVPGLPAGQQTSVNLTGMLTGPTGPQNIVIVTDLNQQIPEGAAGEANNLFPYLYVADAALLPVNGTGTLTVANGNVISLDNGTPDIQWQNGALIPVGTTNLTLLSGFGNFDQAHRDAVSTSATLTNAPLTTVPFGALVGVQTDGGLKFGILEIREATSGGNLVFQFRIYN